MTLLLLSPYLDLFPSVGLIDRFLELTSLAVKDEDRRRVRTAVEALQGLATSNHPLAGEVAPRLEAWRKERKTALKRMEL